MSVLGVSQRKKMRLRKRLEIEAATRRPIIGSSAAKHYTARARETRGNAATFEQLAGSFKGTALDPDARYFKKLAEQTRRASRAAVADARANRPHISILGKWALRKMKWLK